MLGTCIMQHQWLWYTKSSTNNNILAVLHQQESQPFRILLFVFSLHTFKALKKSKFSNGGPLTPIIISCCSLSEDNRFLSFYCRFSEVHCPLCHWILLLVLHTDRTEHYHLFRTAIAIVSDFGFGLGFFPLGSSASLSSSTSHSSPTSSATSWPDLSTEALADPKKFDSECCLDAILYHSKKQQSMSCVTCIANNSQAPS